MFQRAAPPTPDLAATLVSSVVREIDVRKTGRISVEQIIALTERLFRECDRDWDGKLDQTELTELLQRLSAGNP